MADGKDVVDAAESKTAIDTAVSTAKEEINAVEREICEIKIQAKQTYLDAVVKPEHPEATITDVSFRPFLGVYNGSLVAIFYGGKYHGMFPENEISYELEGMVFAFSNGYPILVWNDGSICELATAYEQGLVTKKNLVTIHNLYYDIEDGTEGKMETQAKQTYLDTVVKPEHPEATITDVSFRPFLGVYNGSLVAIFYGGQYHGEFPEVEVEYELEGLKFAYSKGYPILVWNDGNICELPAAYAQDFITKENLIAIHDLYYNID